jgi:hypothetical protein
MKRSSVASILMTLALTATMAHPLRAATNIDPPAPDDDQITGAAPVVPASPETPAPPAQATAEAPPKREWHGTATAGFQLLAGTIDARGTTSEGRLTRPFADDWTFVARGSYTYSTVTVSDSPKIDKVQSNRLWTSAGADYTFGSSGIAIVRSLYLRDPLHEITYRAEELAGVGVHLKDSAKRVEFTFVPGISLLKEDTFLPGSEAILGGAGFYQALSLKIDRTWSIEDNFTFRHDFRRGDYSIESNATLAGMLTTVIGLQVEYEYIRESLVAPGTKPSQQTTTIGFRLKF